MPDYTLEDTIYKRFSTRIFASGIPGTLAGTPVVSAYEDDSTTQITAGITLGVDHDSVTGLNLLTIVATAANGYEAGKSYDLVITTGTVSGVSVVGEVVWHFTLGAEAAAVDLANGTDGLGALKTGIDAIPTTAMRGTDNAALASVATEARLAELDAGNLPADIAAIPTTAMRGTDSAALASVATEARLAELDAGNLPADVDAALTRLPSALISGKMDSDIEAINDNTEAAVDLSFSARTIVRGTAQTGTLSTTVMTSDVSEATDDHYIGRIIIWTSGALADQATDITDYSGTNGTFTYAAVTEAPANNDTFVIV